METKWGLVFYFQPVVGLLLLLIGIYTFVAGSPHLLPWAFILTGPLFSAMAFIESQAPKKNASIFYSTLAAIAFLFGFYSFIAF
ncbi:hypothetical protein [Lysinibacillus endophyticus]|uniref:DUF3953 domain-containing protein n=1 Tax=Ureibacillus endophyticus TaxID=1978490 RepID=A0A494YUC1_9BACL|nr:hypothetical protein [Lysinibacillus endophyticus]MCP1143490.1 hypothetical protein [Lysinibacillus endophyticus]RKQ13696.1 hypothetical protein D8M03_15470 [Lysinibacillus endophyticus]